MQAGASYEASYERQFAANESYYLGSPFAGNGFDGIDQFE